MLVSSAEGAVGVEGVTVIAGAVSGVATTTVAVHTVDVLLEEVDDDVDVDDDEDEEDEDEAEAEAVAVEGGACFASCL